MKMWILKRPHPLWKTTGYRRKRKRTIKVEVNDLEYRRYRQQWLSRQLPAKFTYRRRARTRKQAL